MFCGSLPYPLKMHIFILVDTYPFTAAGRNPTNHVIPSRNESTTKFRTMPTTLCHFFVGLKRNNNNKCYMCTLSRWIIIIIPLNTLRNYLWFEATLYAILTTISTTKMLNNIIRPTGSMNSHTMWDASTQHATASEFPSASTSSLT